MNFWQEAEQMQEELVARRRDLHKHPENGWNEFRTASIVATELTKLGYEVSVGADVVVEEEMMGRPSLEESKACMERAIAEGADPKWVEKMVGGKTAVMGVMHFKTPGNIVGLRFDMDCNDVGESTEESHFPNQEGFASTHKNLMHACGHDGHVTIGLGVAKLISEHKDEMAGTVKFFFQPGEEGVRAARAMVASGICDDVKYLLGGHIGFNCKENNAVVCMTKNFLATSKLDVHFKGVAAHAGGDPEKGKNALLAAAAATLSLHGISRHSGGASRINVGVLEAGTGRNVVGDTALLKIETRGSTTEVNDYVRKEAVRMIKGAALMYDVEYTIEEAGGASAGVSTERMGKEVFELLTKANEFNHVYLEAGLGGSEDCSYFMNRVQENGGEAIYMMHGAELAAGHHNRSFNFDESVLSKAVGTLSFLVKYYTHKEN